MSHPLRITLLLAAVASTPPSAAQSACADQTALDKLKSQALSMQETYQRYERDYLGTSQKKLAALDSVQRCQSEKSLVGDITDALTLQRPKCNREISEYNLLNERQESLVKMLDIQRSIVQDSAQRFALAAANRCSP